MPPFCPEIFILPSAWTISSSGFPVYKGKDTGNILNSLQVIPGHPSESLLYVHLLKRLEKAEFSVIQLKVRKGKRIGSQRVCVVGLGVGWQKEGAGGMGLLEGNWWVSRVKSACFQFLSSQPWKCHSAGPPDDLLAWMAYNADPQERAYRNIVSSSLKTLYFLFTCSLIAI